MKFAVHIRDGLESIQMIVKLFADSQKTAEEYALATVRAVFPTATVSHTEVAK